MIENIQLSAIDSDTRNQMRDGIRDDVVDEYAAAMRDGATFPPVVVFADGGNRYHLADGFHRVKAAQAAGIASIQADVRDGDHRAARLHAAGANATHGLRRTNADKRRSVMALLEDDEWSQLGDREIARHCGVTHPFVGKMRSSLYPQRATIEIPRDNPEMAADILIKKLGDKKSRELAKMLERDIAEIVSLADSAKKKLTPSKYREWLSSEFGWTPDDLENMRSLVTVGVTE